MEDSSSSSISHLVLKGRNTIRRFQNLVQDRVPSEGDHFLGEVADFNPFGNKDIPAIDRFLSQDHPEKGRLPRTVRADQAHPISHSDLKGTVLEEDFAQRTVSERD